MIEGQRILVAGGGGSIGSELVRQLAVNNEVFVFDISETGTFDLVEELRLVGHQVKGAVGDVRDTELLETVFSQFRPEIVFNASARKHVTPMEQTPMEAVSVNVNGTWNLLRLSQKYGVNKFVNTSTDKVVNADCVMGITKRLSELLVRNAGGVSVRFGNVLASQGSLLPLWNRNVAQGKAITVTDERCERYMMTIENAVHLMILAAEDYQEGVVYILKMGEPIKIIDLAKRLVAQIKQESGKHVDIEMIGLRPGEKLKEKLMSEDEEKMAKEHEHYWTLYAT